MKFYLNALIQQQMARKLDDLDREESKRRHPASQTNTEENE
jgi:hypothetical protein